LYERHAIWLLLLHHANWWLLGIVYLLTTSIVIRIPHLRLSMRKGAVALVLACSMDFKILARNSFEIAVLALLVHVYLIWEWI
jgi:hypothetical protein